MRIRNLAILVALLVAVPLGWGDNFWEKQPYTRWSRKDAQRLLEQSPWCQSITLGSVAVDVSQRGRGGMNSGSLNVERAEAPKISYAVQLRSAPMVRRAVARLSQLDNNYDQLGTEQKAALDAKLSKYLSATFPDSVVAYVTYSSNVQDYYTELRRYWRRQDINLLKPTVFLNAGGEKLPLMGYVAGDNQFQFVFPRPANLPPEGSISVEFVHPNLDPKNTAEMAAAQTTRSGSGPTLATAVIGESRLRFEFKLKAMTVNGTPEF